MGLLDGRVAVVTGAGRGIGRDIARCLAGEGAKVVVNDVGVSLAGDGGLDNTAGVGQGPHASEEPGLGRPGGIDSTAGVGQGPHASEEPGLGRPGGIDSTAGAGQGPPPPEEPGLGRPGGIDSTDPAKAVCAEIEAAGGEAVPNHDSVSDFEAAGRIVGAATEAFGRLDILVNNAGIVRDRTLVKMDEADYDAVIAVHQKGTFNTARHAAPIMKEAGYGRIVNITSSAGLRGNFGQSNYGAAKAAIMGMTFVWAVELGRYGITVNAVAPAGFTRMTEGLYQGAEPPPDQDPALNAPLVAFLASEGAAYVNGQVLGRTGFAYTIFQTPRQVAAMWREGGWTPQQVADDFHDVLGQHLQPVGMPAHPLLGKKG